MSAISHILANFKKLGKAKMTLTLTQQRLVFLKEAFIKVQELHYKITRIADEKLKATHIYFIQ